MNDVEGRGLRLLVVDDDEVDRMAVARALRTVELEVETSEAGDVAAAREALATGDFDCALVDYNLPDGEGRDVLEAALALEDPVPVIMLTGHGDEGLAVELMKEGARDYIPKAQLSPARLGRSLRHVVDVSRAERETRRARRAQQFLVDVSAQLAQSLDHEATLRRIAVLPVPAMADLALLYLREGESRLRRVASAHVEPAVAKALEGERVFELRAGSDSPVSSAVASDDAVFVPDVQAAWPDAGPMEEAHMEDLRRQDPRSLIVLPLKARGRVLGGLAVAYAGSGRRYDEQDLAVLQNMAGRAALALDNARLYQEVRDEVRLMETLRDLGERITSELDMETLVREVTDRATELTGARFGAFYQATGKAPEEEPPFVLYCACGAEDEPPPGLEIDFTPHAVTRPTLGEGSHLAVPVVVQDHRVVGGLLFGHDDAGAFGEREERIARGIASWAAVAIQNARLYEGAQQAARARDDMLAVVSHDLRNPLNVISTSAALILEIPLPEEKKRLQLETIRRTTERMNRLIQDLLDVTSIEAGKLHIAPRPTGVEDLVGEAWETMEPLARERGIVLEREGPEADVPVLVDRERIHQVFSNLIGNAIKFTPEGGQIFLGARCAEDEVLFWVADTGTGIRPEDQENLFDRFWRGQHNGSSGTGLGLPIARGIVEMHGGAITVESDGSSGTCFTFTIPRSEEAPA